MKPAPIELEVRGVPAAKGSATAFVVKGKGGGRHRAVVVPGGSKVSRAKLLGWEATVRDAAANAIGATDSPPFVGLALRVEVEFRIARPRGHYRTGKRAHELLPSSPASPITKPDLDKLVRSTWDALTGIVFDDDSRIVEALVRKVYATAGTEGARIRVEFATDSGLQASSPVASAAERLPPVLRIVRAAPADARERIRAMVDGTKFGAESYALRAPAQITPEQVADLERASNLSSRERAELERIRIAKLRAAPSDVEDDFGGPDL